MKAFNYISIFAITSFLSVITVQAQVTIGLNKTPDSSALLELVDNINNTSSKGLLLPRLTLDAVTDEAPLSRHVEAMMAYNIGNNISKDVYINNGNKWHPLGYLPSPTQSGQYLSVDASNNLIWKEITVPTPPTGIYTLMNSISRNRYEIREIDEDQSPWIPFGDTIQIIPRHAKNKLIVTIQVFFNKEYDANHPTGWINYSGGIFISNLQALGVRNGTLSYQDFNKSRTYSLVTLHFVVEDLAAGIQNIVVKFRRDDSYNFNGILYIGYDDRSPSDQLSFFNTSSSISVQYYEDKSSTLI